MPRSAAVHIIDLCYLGVPQTIASYLVVGPNGPSLIEVGPGSTFPRLVAGLKEHGFAISDLSEILVTHIHLDHAGAAGQFFEHGFRGRVHVHEFGAPHLIDPSKLIDSARRIYGDQMDRLWGRIVPVPEEQVVALRDGDVIDAGGVQFTTMYTPGHARHHCCFSMPTRRRPVCFVGDAAGMVVPRDREAAGPAHYPFINLPTPPPEFNLEQWLDSIARIEHARFGSLYLTHFSEVCTPDSHLLAVRRALRAHSEFIRSALRAARGESNIVDEYKIWVLRQASAAGISPEQASHFLSENLLRMNVTGMVRYWRNTTGA